MLAIFPFNRLSHKCLRIIESIKFVKAKVWFDLSKFTSVFPITILHYVYAIYQTHPCPNLSHNTSSMLAMSYCHGDCYIGRNPYTGEQYLIAAIPKGIMLLQWFQPRHIFMMVKVSIIWNNITMSTIII